jgi:uncharacterized protein
VNDLALNSRVAGTMEIVVVQPTPFCNIACTYCYLPSRDAKSVIAIDTVKTLFGKVFASPYPAPQLTVIWHAGEPLVVPAAFYREAFDVIEAMRPPSLEVRHAFQTNGILLSPEWCDLFKRYDIGVGVSIDGPKHLHDARRLTRAGRGTFDKAMAGIRLLQSEGVPFHVITVLSKEHLVNPEMLVDFYLEAGIKDICFNVEESEGDHVSDLFAVSNLQGLYGSFLERFWNLARASGKFRFIREIDSQLPRIFRPNEAVMRNIQVEPFAMLNVDCKGNVSSFSPELLGYKNAAYNDFIVGNILTDELDEMLSSASMHAMMRDIHAGVEACRATCDYYSVCGGGAPVNKLSEHGRFGATRTSFCSLTQMAPVDLILNAFENAGRDLDAIALPTNGNAGSFNAVASAIAVS